MKFVKVDQTNIQYVKSIVKEFRDQEITDAKASAFVNHPTTVCFACIEDETAIGYVYAYRLPRMDNGNDILELYHLFVKKEHRKKGIAKTLVSMMLDYAREEQIHYAFLLTGNDDSYIPARKLYESLGGYNHPIFKETYYWYITGKPQA